MKGMNNEYSHTFHHTNLSTRKVFPKQGLSVLKNDIRKAPLHLRLVLFTSKNILD